MCILSTDELRDIQNDIIMCLPWEQKHVYTFIILWQVLYRKAFFGICIAIQSAIGFKLEQW